MRLTIFITLIEAPLPTCMLHYRSFVRERGGARSSFGNVALIGVGIAATYSPYRQGGLASKTANSNPFPVCTVPAVSYDVDQGLSDGFPSLAEHPDEFPCSADLRGCEHSEGRILHSTPDCESTAFTRNSRVAEKSEELRQSDCGVQNLPANVSSSELSAHQMGGALAGEVRITKIEPSGMDAEGSDGCSLFGLTPVPFVSLLIAGSTGAVESAEDVPSEQREGSQKWSTVTSAFVDVVLSESLIISDTQRF